MSMTILAVCYYVVGAIGFAAWWRNDILDFTFIELLVAILVGWIGGPVWLFMVMASRLRLSKRVIWKARKSL